MDDEEADEQQHHDEMDGARRLPSAEHVGQEREQPR